MRIAIVGAGAIGTWFAVRLARSGFDVSVLARGATLAAMQSRGAQLLVKDEVLTAKVTASDRPAELGTQDLIIVTVKGTALAGVAASVSELLGPETNVLSAMNGVPWWFFHGLPGAMANASLQSVDAGGAIQRRDLHGDFGAAGGFFHLAKNLSC